MPGAWHHGCTLLPQNKGMVASWTGVARSNLRLLSTCSVSGDISLSSLKRRGPAADMACNRRLAMASTLDSEITV